MQTTANYNLKKPENTDPVDIQDLNDNADILDEEIKKKVNASGGDISNTTIKTLDNITTEFPVPEAGEKPGTFLAKVRKFIQDFNNFKTGIITVGKLANNGSTTAAGMALDARYGKTLYDYYTQLNSDLFKDRGQVSDPNNITKTGMYYMTSGTPHAPTTLGFCLIHFSSGGRTVQIAFINGTSSNYYIRSKNTSTLELSEWRRIVTAEEMVYQAGDKISVNRTWINGTLTNANKYIYIEIPIRKTISGSISFTPTSLSVRQNGNYLAETITSFAGYTFDTIKAGDIGIRIRMERTGGWGGINNESVAVALDGSLLIQ